MKMNDHFRNLNSFEELTESDCELLSGLYPVVSKDMEKIFNTLYDYLIKYDKIKGMVLRLEHLTGGTYRQIFISWLLNLFGGKYGRDYFDERENAVLKYIEAEIPLKTMLLNLGFVRTLLDEYLYREFGKKDPELMMQAVLAIGKLIDQEIVVITRVYYNQNKESGSFFKKKNPVGFE